MFDTLLFVQAFECRLCEVGPLPSPHSPVGTWSPRASQRFIQMTENKKLAAKVAFYNFYYNKFCNKDNFAACALKALMLSHHVFHL